MPILDPQQQYFLSTKEISKKSNIIGFYEEFLKRASELYTKKYVSIRDYMKFKDSFLDSIESINNLLQLNIPEREELEKKNIINYYDYFYNFLQTKYGGFHLAEDYFYINSNTYLNFFEVGIFPRDNNNHHNVLLTKDERSWYFTDSHFAILAIHKISDVSLIRLEISLMKSI